MAYIRIFNESKCSQPLIISIKSQECAPGYERVTDGVWKGNIHILRKHIFSHVKPHFNTQ